LLSEAGNTVAIIDTRLLIAKAKDYDRRHYAARDGLGSIKSAGFCPLLEWQECWRISSVPGPVDMTRISRASWPSA